MSNQPDQPALRDRLLHVLRQYVLSYNPGPAFYPGLGAEASAELVAAELLFVFSPELGELDQARATIARARELAKDPNAEWMYITPRQLLTALDGDQNPARIAALQAAETLVVPPELLPAPATPARGVGPVMHETDPR